MKRNVNGKIVILLTTAALCFAGCSIKGDKESITTETTIKTTESTETVNGTESTMTSETTETAAQDSSSQEQVSTAESSESSVVEIQSGIDVKSKLEEAEQNASVLQQKLTQDASLTQKDMNDLSYEIYMVWDDLLNELWGILKENLDQEVMDKLLQEQRGWISQKEAEVKLAGEKYAGGSIALLVSNQKAAELTKERVYELAVYLGLE